MQRSGIFSTADTQAPLQKKLKTIPKESKKQKQDDQDDDETTEQQEEGEEEKEQEETFPSETLAKVKFRANRVIFDDNGVQKDLENARKSNKSPPGKAIEEYYEQHRPPFVEKIKDDDERRQIYGEVDNYIEFLNSRKDTLALDPFYEFLVLVSGRINTLLKRLGIETMPSAYSAAKMFETSGAPPPLGPPTTPQKQTFQSPTKAAQLSRPKETVESRSSPLYTPREYADSYRTIENAFTASTTPDAQQKKAELLRELEDSQRTSKQLETKLNFFSWMNKDELIGRAQISELVYSSAKSMWLRIVTRVAPHLNEAPFESFVTDPKMQILFSEIVAFDIATVRFLHATRSQLDQNYARAKREQEMHMADLRKWTFDKDTNRFDPNGRLSNSISMSGHPPGAPRSLSYGTFPQFY